MSKSTRRLGRAGIAAAATTALVASGLTAFAGAASASEPVDLERIKGDNRYGTSVAAAKAYGETENVFLASGEEGHYVDALSANFLSGVRTAPILLARQDKLPGTVKQQIDDGGYSTVTIIGGDAAISESVEAEVRAMGVTVNRLAGSNRYRTNADVIDAGAAEAADTALIATGMNFPDALGAGPVAYAGKHPIGLTKTDDIPDFVVDSLKDAGVDKAIIVGGTSAVSEDVEDELEAKGIDVVERLSSGPGGNREDTSIAVREFAIENLGFSESEVDFASGRDEAEGIDALSGGPVSGKEEVAILITRTEDRARSLVAYLEEKCEDADEGDIYGGNAAISLALEGELEDAMQCDEQTNPNNQTVTSRPELVNAQIVTTNAAGPNVGTTIRYTFDENITGMNPDDDSFYAYFYDGTHETSVDAIVDPTNNRAVLARFADITVTAEPAASGLTGAESLRVATVDFGAVKDDGGAENPIGDAQLAAGSETPGGTTGFQAGITAAPDLVGVSNFRQVPNQNLTVVDFTFDEAAYLVNGDDNDNFYLVLTDGTTEIEGVVQNGNGTTKFEVVFDSTGTGGLTATNVQRGTIEPETVSDSAADATLNDDGIADNADDDTVGALNPLQAVDVAERSASPDLVSATLGNNTPGDAAGNDYIDYKFDEAVTELVVGTNFAAYNKEGEEIASSGVLAAQRSTTDNTVVRVFFTDGALTRAVGATVVDDAVRADDGAPMENHQDEVGVSNNNTDPTAGSSTVRTEGPDLTGVAVNEVIDQFGGSTGTYTATYTFDEQLDEAVAPTPGDFRLYLANGDFVTATSCEVDMVPDTTTLDLNDEIASNTVTCDDFDGTDGQPGQAVLGTVDDDTVNDADSTPAGVDEGNPEGAAVVS